MRKFKKITIFAIQNYVILNLIQYRNDVKSEIKNLK